MTEPREIFTCVFDLEALEVDEEAGTARLSMSRDQRERWLAVMRASMDDMDVSEVGADGAG